MPDAGYVSKAGNGGSGAAPSVTKSVTAGNLVELWLGHGNASSPTITAAGGITWTQQTQNVSGSITSTLWTGFAVSTGSITITCSITSAAYAIVATEFSGVDTTTPVASTGTYSKANGLSGAMASAPLTIPAGGIFSGHIQHSTTATLTAYGTATDAGAVGRSFNCSRASVGGTTEDGNYTHTLSCTGSGVSAVYRKVSAGGPTYPQLERGVRGLNRGLTPGLAH